MNVSMINNKESIFLKLSSLCLFVVFLCGFILSFFAFDGGFCGFWRFFNSMKQYEHWHRKLHHISKHTECMHNTMLVEPIILSKPHTPMLAGWSSSSKCCPGYEVL